MRNRSTISWSITLGALMVAVTHVVWPEITIDAVTLILLAIAIIPWLAPLFKTVELPGGVKIEFSDLEKTRQKAQSAGLLARGGSGESTKIEDPNLALAALRIALERQLRKIAERNGIHAEGRSVSSLVRVLRQKDLLRRDQSSLLSDLLPSLNKAVHGAEVDPRASQWAAEVGPWLIEGLEVATLINIDDLVDSREKSRP